MSAENTAGLDKAAQENIGTRLEDMFHSATAIYDLATDLVESTESGSQHLLRAIREIAKVQARDLEDIAAQLTGDPTGFFADHFKES